MAETLFQKIKQGASGKRGLSFAFLAASLLCSIATLGAYLRFGSTSFTPVLSGAVIGLLGACAALSALLCVFEIKIGKYMLYLLGLLAWLKLLVYNAAYISNVLVGIDGNRFTPGFLLAAGAGLLAWALALASAILQKTEFGPSPAPVGGQDGEE